MSASGAAGVRLERDAFGDVEIPADRYWGAQTERARRTFRIGSERLPSVVIHAFGLQKAAALHANVGFGLIPEDLVPAMDQACAELASGHFDEHFPLPVWQTGSGTQTNMNANEVLANRANELLGRSLGSRAPVHPNDHVNRSQSSNDSFPTVMNVAAVLAAERDLLPALHALHAALSDRAMHFGDIVKIGRTHLNDALPMTLGQAFLGYARQVELARRRIEDSLEDVRQLAQGGTAIGTGLNAPDGFDEAFCRELTQRAGTPFQPNPIKFEGMAAHDDLVALSAALSGCATALTKIVNDLRLLGSGPRCGLAELVLPDDGLTSSIMPGKRNATLAEALLQVCHRVVGNHLTVELSGASGLFELNVAKPVIAHAILQSIELLSDASGLFGGDVVLRLEANREQLERNVSMSLMLATVLTPRLGYDAVAQITRLAEKENLSVEEAAIRLGLMDREELRKALDPLPMIGPQGGKAGLRGEQIGSAAEDTAGRQE